MFLRKILSTENKIIWVFIDLMIVIIGVYCAFLIQNAAAEQSDQKEKVKIYSALKMELETMRVMFPQFAQSNVKVLKRAQGEENLDISGWRFIEPQYGYQIIEYAIKIQNTEIIDFEMYNELQALFVGIKQLEHMERLLTEAAGNYQFMVPELSSDHPLNLERKANNRFQVDRFKMFLQGRASNLNRTSGKATELLSTINDVLGPDMSKQIDLKFISEYAPYIPSIEEAVELANMHFPHLTEEEVTQVYNRAKGIDESTE